MNRFYDDFDGYNNKRHRESLSKKNKYEEEEFDDLDIIADDISEKFMGSYGIHNITPSKAKSAVVIYVDELSDITESVKKEIEDMAKPYSAIIKSSKLKNDNQHLEKYFKH
jgi:hypothetical protein